MPQILALVDQPIDSVRPSLKEQGFFLTSKKEDVSTTYLYFTALNKDKEGVAWVRSVSLMQVSRSGLQSRLVRYRTYEASEYRSLLDYLLYNGYQTENSYDFGGARHTLYKGSGREIRLIVKPEKTPDGKNVTAYEIETGK